MSIEDNLVDMPGIGKDVLLLEIAISVDGIKLCFSCRI